MIDVSVFLQGDVNKQTLNNIQTKIEQYEDSIPIAGVRCDIDEGEYGYYLFIPYSHAWIWQNVKEDTKDIRDELSGLIRWYDVACPEFETKLDLIMFIERVLPVLEHYIREVRR